MNKSKLQELCQKRAWRLPEYKVTREGEDHNPRFQATVIVNGMTFQSQNPAKSSKAAQDEAAHHAFLLFTAPPPPPLAVPAGSSNAVPNFDSNNANRSMLQSEAYQDPRVNELASVGNNNEKFKDMQHFYKNVLQNYAQKRNLIRPVYACEAEGPPHATRFRCKVTIDGKTYESLEFFPTIKEAEHAAARIALSSLAPNAIEEEDVSLYKNLLQELTQKAGWPLPIYTTTRSGEAHASMFFSAVEVKGEVFTGQAAKTKKQAEFLAAKVAYAKFKEGKSNRDSMDITPAYLGQEVHVVSSSHLPTSVHVETQQKNRGPEAGILINSSSAAGVDRQEGQVSVTSAGHLSVPFPQPETMQVCPSNPDHQPMEGDLSTSNKPANEMSTISCNRVVVRPRVPNMNFPAGSTVLPMSDDQWAAVKLESEPNQ